MFIELPSFLLKLIGVHKKVVITPASLVHEIEMFASLTHRFSSRVNFRQ